MRCRTPLARWKKKLEINHDYINEGKKPEPVPPRQTISTGSHVYIKESEMPWCSEDWLGVVHRIDGGGRYKVIPINPEKYKTMIPTKAMIKALKIE